MPVSPATRTKCIARARKEVRLQKKWGRWGAAFMILIGVLILGCAIGFIILLQLLLQQPGNPGPGFQNWAWLGFTLGIVFGFMTLVAGFKGVNAIVHGIQMLRGDPISQILVEYHDALVNVMHEEQCPPPDQPNAAAARSDSQPLRVTAERSPV
jgi:hypothetical protein